LDGRTVAGKRLHLAGWFKTDSLKELAYLKLYCNTVSRGMVASEPGQTLSMTNDWTLLSLEMDAPFDTYEVWAWFAHNAPAAGLVYLDDASLEVVGPALSLKPPAPAVAPKPAPKTRPPAGKSTPRP